MSERTYPSKNTRVDRENLSVCLHTALRKLCDSTPTSAAWNLFHVLDDETVHAFYEAVWSAVSEVPQDAEPETVVSAIRHAILDGFDYIGKPPRALTRCVFKMFSEDDWSAYCAYLTAAWQKV